MTSTLIFVGFMLYLYAYGAGLGTAAVASAGHYDDSSRRATAVASLAIALWPLTLLGWAARRAYRRLRPPARAHLTITPSTADLSAALRRAATSAEAALHRAAGHGLPRTQPCTQHHGADRVRYGCSGPDPDDVEPLLTDAPGAHSAHGAELDAASRALRADVQRRHRADQRRYVWALAQLIGAVDALHRASAEVAGEPGYLSAHVQLWERIIFAAERARPLVDEPPAAPTGEAGRG